MSGIKRSFNADENSAIADGDREPTASPDASPRSKKSRHSSSHSDTEEETQVVQPDDNITNGHSTSQSETEIDDDEDEEEEEEEEEPHLQDKSLHYSLVPVDFDNGKDDIYRYDGTIVLHIHLQAGGRLGQVYSEPSVIRTLPWTLVAHIKAGSDTLSKENVGTMGLFLKCTPDKTVQNWSIFAKAGLTLFHATDPEKNFVKKINHLFNSRSDDWGFHQFKSLKEIRSEYLHAPDDTIRIEARIHADPPRNVEWNSKDQTGFVGLKNIGATCYMNSLLQTIYFTKKLRKAVYALPTDNDEQSHSISLALQKLFYDLQCTDRPVNTKKLTQSFGWDKPDEFCQQDIQEFCRVLLDRLECKMEGTTSEGIIPSLFQGQYVQYIRCTKVERESRAQQTFYDVPLQVRNNANITESFRDFCKSEILTGDNSYDAGGVHGLQEAEKGVKFQKLPPVLCLHLLRFEYDCNLAQNRKINDSYSFDSQLDLSEFLEKPNCSPSSYKLLSILVHSGDNSSGHYVSFINPALDGQWFKFDDDVVGRVASKDAMERNFGGMQDDDGSMYNTSAYMLVYIREDCQKDVLCDINLEDIPENLVKRFNHDKRPVKRRQVLSDNSSLDVQLIFNDDFFIQPKACLTELISENALNSSSNNRCLRYMTTQFCELFGVFARRLACELGVNLEHDVRLWIVHAHAMHINHNHYHSQLLLTSRLTCCNDYEKKIIDVFGYGISDRTVFSIFVEQKVWLNNLYQLLPVTGEGDILIFVRFYNPREESLMYIGHFLFPSGQILQKCLNEIAARMNLSPSAASTFIVHQSVPKHNHLHLYESIKPSNFELPLSQALRPCLSGASIIVQILDIKSTDAEDCFTTVDDYLQDLQSRQEFDVYNRDSSHNECLFQLFVSLKTPIKDVIRAIAERIDYPEEQIIIQKSLTSTSTATTLSFTSTLHIGCVQTLRDFFPNIRLTVASPRKIFFKRLPFRYSELEHRRVFRVYVTNSRKRDEQREVQFFVQKSATVADFLTQIRQWLPAISSEDESQQLRMTELIFLSQVNPLFQLRICPDQSSMDTYTNCPNHYYHIEEVVSNDSDQSPDSVLIPVAHYIRDTLMQVNVQKFFPFFLDVIQNESFHDVKQRLQKQLGLSNREFDKYRFSIFSGSKVISRCDDNATRINLNDLKLAQSTCWLGLETPPVSNGRKTRKSLLSEKPVRIS